MSYDDIFGIFDHRIAEINKRTEEEFVERYEAFGFTKDDYEETKEMSQIKFVTWELPEMAKNKGVKPQEIVAGIFLRCIGAHLSFPQSILRTRG